MAGFTFPILTVLLTSLPRAFTWGITGSEAVAYVATNFVANSTRSYFQALLGSTCDDYLASVASWADDWKFTEEGAFSYRYHYISAQDYPPYYCGVSLGRDCKDGCVVTAIANYTSQLVENTASKDELQIAAKLIIHLVGDVGRPLNCESMDDGGNRISVTYGGTDTNLHHIWDTAIPETIAGGGGRSDARDWAADLSREIKSGEFSDEASAWVSDLDLHGLEDVVLGWAAESNALVCSTVIPDGVETVQSGELRGNYERGVTSSIELQVAKQGYRLARLLDAIVEIQ